MKGTVKHKQEFEIFDACKQHVEKHFKGDQDFNAFVRVGAYDIGREKDVVFEVCTVELRDAVLARMHGQACVRPIRPNDSVEQAPQ